MMKLQLGAASPSAGPDSRKSIWWHSRVNQEARRFSKMAMTADDILAHPVLAAAVQSQAQALLLIHQASPRPASPFATQHRWLMAQAALAAYFRNEAQQTGSGLPAQRFVDVIDGHNLASRDTAAVFVNEMLKYGVARHVVGSEGRRRRPIEPSPTTLEVLSHFLLAHLATLDRLDGGARSAVLREQPAMLGALQPLVADGLLASRAVRQPRGPFSLFTWIDDGGVVMDSLVVGCRQEPVGLTRIPTDVTSVSALARRLNLSRSQLGRKFAAAEAMGCLGWSGARGKSALWVSAAFWREYHIAQAVKLAIIDAAVAVVFAHGVRAPAFAAVASP